MRTGNRWLNPLDEKPFRIIEIGVGVENKGPEIAKTVIISGHFRACILLRWYIKFYVALLMRKRHGRKRSLKSPARKVLIVSWLQVLFGFLFLPKGPHVATVLRPAIYYVSLNVSPIKEGSIFFLPRKT